MDGGESSGDESACGVWELDVEQLRGKLREQPVEEWRGRNEEIHACEESIRKKEDLEASAAISANGCCQCFTVHMYLAVFVVWTAGLLLTAVGAAGTAPRLTPSNVFQKYQGVEECVMLRNGDLIPVSKWSGDPKELCDFSCEKMEARMEKAKELEPEPEEPEPSGEEEGEFKCEECGRCFDKEKGLNMHITKMHAGGVENDDVDYEAETAAARAFLDGSDLGLLEIVDAADVAGINGLTFHSPADRLLEKVHDEVEGLKGAELRAKLRTVDVALATAASDAQRRDAYVLARVKRVVEPVLLARTNFYDESGVFRRPLCEAYVRGLRKRQERDRADRLRKMIKGLGGDTCSGLRLAAIEAALVDAYEAKTPEVVEASTYNPLAAPKIEEVIAKHGEKLRGRANDDAVLEAVAETATRLLQQTKGGFMATNGSVVYVHTLWLLRLIVDGRTVSPHNGTKIFEDFKADDEGKRDGYFEADGWWSAVGLEEAERAPYNHSAPFDEAHHTLGEVVWGGNGTEGRVIVCFIIEGRKFFVLFQGREDFVLVNKVTMDCLAYFASLALPILLAEAADSRERAAGFLDSDKLPRLKDILASKRDEVNNRGNFRHKWNAMTGFMDGFYARVLRAIAEKGGTITEAPGRLSRAADDGVPKQGPRGSADGPEDHWHFDEGQVGNLILRLRGGGSGMCSGGRRGGRGRRDSDDDDGVGPTGTGSSGGGGAKKKKRPRNMGGLMGTDWSPRQWRAGTNG